MSLLLSTALIGQSWSLRSGTGHANAKLVAIHWAARAGATFKTAFLVVAVLCCRIASASGQSPYELKSGQEWTLLGVGAAMGLSGLAVIHNIDPFTQADLAALDVKDINSFDRAGMKPYRTGQDADVLAYVSAALPLTLLIDERTRQDWKTLGVMYGEVLILQSGLEAIAKGLVHRTRPYAYDPNTPTENRTSKDARISFYSGHTSITAASCFFLAKVFSDYPFSRTTKTIAWSAAAIYPAVVGFLRVDSGHHFRTDVLAGYAVGAAIGYLVPTLHRALDGKNASAGGSVTGSPTLLHFTFAF